MPSKSPLERGLASDPPCHPQACAIQDCIQSNRYDESKCQKQIDALYACCAEFYKRNGDDARTVSCPKPKLLDLKMKQRKEEKEKSGGSGGKVVEGKSR